MTRSSENIFYKSWKILDGCISGSEAQVDVVSSALPTGAATSAKQDTQISAEQAIQGGVGATTDAAASVSADEDGTARSTISLLKGAKNLLIDISGYLAGILTAKIDQTTDGATNRVVAKISQTAGENHVEIAEPYSPAGDVITASIAAENTFSDELTTVYGAPAVLTLSGTWVASVYLQQEKNDSGTWEDVATFTGNGVTKIEILEGAIKLRVGVKTGGYTSGTVAARLAQGTAAS